MNTFLYKCLERGLLLSAALAVSVFAVLWFTANSGTSHADEFMADRAASVVKTANSDKPAVSVISVRPANSAKPRSRDLKIDMPDTSDWSGVRKQKFLGNGRYEGATSGADQVLAVIDIAEVGVRAPIYRGTDHHALNQGAGFIKGTSDLYERGGNVGVAAHRDSFFRGLKDIKMGQTIVVSTPTHDLYYSVSDTSIVEPSDVRVLYPDGQSKLTLVTCYPFYFLGKAPKRFIVSATLTGSKPI